MTTQKSAIDSIEENLDDHIDVDLASARMRYWKTGATTPLMPQPTAQEDAVDGGSVRLRAGWRVQIYVRRRNAETGVKDGLTEAWIPIRAKT